VEAYRRGDLAAARDTFEKAIQVNSKDSESFALNALSLARVEQAAGNAAAAQRALDLVLDSAAAPGLRAEAAGRKAQLALAAGDLAGAAQWQAKAEALCGGCRAQAAILNIGARIALAGGQPAAATRLAERVLALPAADETRAERANAQRILAEAVSVREQRLAQPAVGAPREEVR
jgi:Tfp pilus assembly protein PilF